jgi:hypothetical protein
MSSDVFLDLDGAAGRQFLEVRCCLVGFLIIIGKKSEKILGTLRICMPAGGGGGGDKNGGEKKPFFCVTSDEPRWIFWIPLVMKRPKTRQ